MNNLRKYCAIAGAGAIGILGIALLLKTAGYRRRPSIGEKTMEGLDETVRESIKGLNKAAAFIRNLFEQLTIKKT